ncbi:site-specific integrase [Hymenobacter sp. NBH84]|uniref:site-specific integrase n=1 Tax=Hymenobacter sp. NBH84 TaxID=2596915 RepID=UPI0016257DA8|nr:site-specific integrase [Hymenobacter sp. NBH84]QNE40904.1 site-specific integrase [Hymenobacter sp. NBH84]
MLSISFLLKEPNSLKPTPIFAFVSFSGRRVKVATGLKILPRQWLKGEQAAQTRGLKDNGPLNDRLSKVRTLLTDCYNLHLSNGNLPSAEHLRAAVVLKEAAAVESGPRTFWECHAEWEALTRAAGQVRTAQTYATAARHLREFGEASGTAIDFNLITPTWGDKYTAYLLHTAKQTDNTIHKNLSRLKRFMKWAAERNYHDSTGYTRLTWKRQEPDIITLTAEEVEALEGLDLPSGGYLDNARSLFLLSCYTGLRYSDLVSIRAEHLRGQTLRLTTQKTRETVSIPLQSRALPIVQRMIAGFIRPVSNQKLNDYLKELGQRAAITAPVEVIRFRGGKRESQTVEKWQKLGCHSGRRSFVTLSLERGLRPELVMKITGHRDWKSFKRYVNITEQAVEREFARVYEMPTLLKVAQ